MDSAQQTVMARDGKTFTPSQLQLTPIYQPDLPMMDFLNAVGPVIKGAGMDKKSRNKKNKPSAQSKRRQRARESKETAAVQSEFIFNPDKPWETGKPLTEFTVFQKLAPEIRQMIFLEVFPNAQAVKITEDGYHGTFKHTFTSTLHMYTYRGKATYFPSPLLCVNREARALVMSKYPLAFAQQLGGRPIRFNFKKDILYFESPSAMINFYGGTLPHFQHEMQVKEDMFGYKYDMSEVHDKVQNVAVGNIKMYKGVVGGTLNQYKNLKTVILGGAIGEDVEQPYDMILDFITGDERLTMGWERFQNFKTPEDGNMPLVERLRKDQFDKAVRVDYEQFGGLKKKRTPPPALKPSKVKIIQYIPRHDLPEYDDDDSSDTDDDDDSDIPDTPHTPDTPIELHTANMRNVPIVSNTPNVSGTAITGALQPIPINAFLSNDMPYITLEDYPQLSSRKKNTRGVGIKVNC